jgi:hypothetical protein
MFIIVVVGCVHRRLVLASAFATRITYDLILMTPETVWLQPDVAPGARGQEFCWHENEEAHLCICSHWQLSAALYYFVSGVASIEKRQNFMPLHVYFGVWANPHTTIHIIWTNQQAARAVS